LFCRPLGTGDSTNSHDKNPNKRRAGRSFMRINGYYPRPDSNLAFARSSGRASQTAMTHHHTSEHSNFSQL
jgi:hypothetical protein